MHVVLASASPARLSVLRAAGIDPHVEVADLDERSLLESMPDASPGEKVTMLAGAKATTVARRIATTHPDAIVIGCDSMLLLHDELVGKPADAAEVRRRWRSMAGEVGRLITGHAVLRTVDGEIDRVAEGHIGTSVQFARPTDDELDAYIGTGEPLAVAGAFTLDGRGAWFVDGIVGDPSTVIGISLPLTRRLLAEVGVLVTELWGS